MKKNLFNLKNINKSLPIDGRQQTILKDISFNVGSGEFVCVFGKSGCGKTTLLNIIAGLITPDSGETQFLVESPRIGYIFQENRLLPWLKVKENVSLVLKSRKELSDRRVNNLVLKKLRMVGLEDRGDSYPEPLSGGEKQRISLARALVIDPDLLLMDEPFSHLDEITARALRTDVKKIGRVANTSIILVTHHPVEALYFADKIVVISKRKKGIAKIIKVPKVFSESEDYYETLIRHRSAKQLLKKLINSID